MKNILFFEIKYQLKIFMKNKNLENFFLKMKIKKIFWILFFFFLNFFECNKNFEKDLKNHKISDLFVKMTFQN